MQGQGRIWMWSAIATVMMAHAVGCADGGADAAEPVAGEPIAMVSSEDGSYAEFYELAPGGLMVFAQTERAARLEDLKPVELYEALAGTVAPPALRAAQDRADRALAARPPGALKPGAGGASSLTGLTDNTASLTATAFKDQFCNQGGWDFDFCWLNRTTSLTVQQSASSIHAHLNVLTGSVGFYLERQNIFGGWDRLRFSTVPAEPDSVTTFVSTNTDILPDTYRVRVTAGDGDKYHLAVHGDL